jgi:hypothetical protein
VVRLTAQPAEEGALQHLSVQSIRLRPPVLARDGHARRMNDVGFDPARPQPAGQPEPVASGLEGDGDARDLAPRLGRLAPPALEQAQQRRRISRELLQRVARNPGDDAGDEPTRSAHLDDC